MKSNFRHVAAIGAMFLFVALNACNDKEKTCYIPDERHPLLRQGDSIIFNGPNNTERYIIANKYRGFDDTYYINDCDIVEIRGYWYSKVLIDSTIHLAEIVIGPTGYAVMSTRFNEPYVNRESLDTYIINDVIFENVILHIGDNDNSEETDISRLYYTDLYGIISYELYNGEVYEIDVCCLPEKP